MCMSSENITLIKLASYFSNCPSDHYYFFSSALTSLLFYKSRTKIYF